MSDIMLDLETWGTTSGSALRSIGAVRFSLETGVIQDRFYMNISDESCEVAGLTKDPDTVAWWAKQSEEAQDSLLDAQFPIQYVVYAFADWLGGDNHRIWAQGSNFDPPLWEAACKAVGKSAPWKYYNLMDTRTVYAIFNFNPWSLKRSGTYHNALDDCIHQVACLNAAMHGVKND